MLVDRWVKPGRRRERKSWFVMLFQNAGKYHACRRRVRREVPSHAISVLENDAVGHLRSMIRVDALILDECHVKWSIDVQTVLLWKEHVLRHKIGTVDRWTRRNVQGHETVLLIVELAIAAVRL